MVTYRRKLAPSQYYVTHGSVPGVQVKTMHKEKIKNNKI